MTRHAEGVLSISRKSYMAELRNLLSFMDEENRERALVRIGELFDRAGPEHEEALIASFGSAIRHVLTLEKEYSRAQKTGTTPFTEPMPFPESFQPADGTSPIIAEASPTPDAVSETPSAPEDADSFVRAAADVLEETGSDAEQTWEAISAMDEEFPMEALIPPGEPPLKTNDIVFPEVVYGYPEEEESLAKETSDEPETEPVGENDLTPEEPAVAEESAPEETAAEDVPDAPSEPVEEPSAEPVAVYAPVTASPTPAAIEIAPEEAAETQPDKKTARSPEKPKGKRSTSPGAGRVMAAILVTFPFIVLWAASLVLFVALGLAVMAIGFAACAAGIYFTTYVTGGKLGFMPDMLLVGGGALVCFGLALLLIWTGLWIAVGGFASVLRWTGSVYRKILRKKVPSKGGDQ